MQLDQYKAAYEAAMAQQGVKVTWAEDGGSPYGTDVGGYRNPDNWVATLSRDGVQTTSLVTLGRIAVTGMTAEELAAQDVWSLRYTGAVQSPQGQLPSTWFANEDDDTRRFYELYPERRPGYQPTSTPGPTPTVGAGNHSTQTRQAPVTPNDGTRVTPPAANRVSEEVKLTFWQWNYYNEMATGRSGPAPEDVGVPLGTTLMSGAEWVRAVGNWFGQPASIPPVTGGGTAGVGGNPTTPVIPVGTGGGGTPPPAPPVGGGGGGTPPPTAPPVDLKSFWEWNALKEQSSKIPGDDPAHYGIGGEKLMSFQEWEALTAPYYAAQSAKPPAKGDDNTLLYLGAAAFLLLRKG